MKRKYVRSDKKGTCYKEYLKHPNTPGQQVLSDVGMTVVNLYPLVTKTGTTKSKH